MDFQRLQSNDIVEILNVLGIEATRKAGVTGKGVWEAFKKAGGVDTGSESIVLYSFST